MERSEAEIPSQEEKEERSFQEKGRLLFNYFFASIRLAGVPF
jgi:hypothetical protein